MVEHLGERDLGSLGKRVIARDHQHEPIAAERESFQRAGFDRAGDDADVADALGDQADDLVAEPLLQIHAYVWMRGQERAQRFGQELGERIGIRQNSDLAGHAARIGAEILVQALGPAQDAARMLEQRAAGLGRRHPLPSPHQQRGPERLLHVTDARAGGGKRQVRALGAPGDAPRLHDVAEQIEVDEVEAHRSFLLREGGLCHIRICAPDFHAYGSPTAKSKRLAPRRTR